MIQTVYSLAGEVPVLENDLSYNLSEMSQRSTVPGSKTCFQNVYNVILFFVQYRLQVGLYGYESCHGTATVHTGCLLSFLPNSSVPVKNSH
jgi:hypothetical protein